MTNIRSRIFSNKWLPYVILSALGFLIYSQALFFGFTYLDDNTLILDNSAFLSHPGNIFQAFRTDVFHLFNHSAFYYRPILTVFLLLGYQIGGASPFIYHLFGILAHVAAASLVWVFLKKINLGKDISFLLSLIFLIHPALVQAVVWIPGMNDSLLAVFTLLAFVYFINFLESRRLKDLLLHALLFALAIFTKETALFVLPAFVFYALFIRPNRRFESKGRFFIAWGAVLGIWLILRSAALKGSPGLEAGDMLKSIFINSPAALQFIGKIIFPFNLSVLPIIRDTTFIYGAMAVVLAAIALRLTKKKRWNYILFGLFCFFLFLFPSFIRPNSGLAADFIEHRLYLPMVGFLVFASELKPFKNFQLGKRIYFYPALFLTVVFLFLTLAHSRNFSSRTAFWKNAAQNSPHYPLARRNLGAMHYLDGDMESAEKEFKASLELNPREEMAHNNLGLIYAGQGKFKEAEEEYGKELEINPYYDNAYFNLGLLRFKEGRSEEAGENWKKTLSINPGHSGALYNLANLYYSEKNFKEAAVYAGELSQRGFPLPPEFSRLLSPLTLMEINKAP